MDRERGRDAMKGGNTALLPPGTFALAPLAPILVTRDEATAVAGSPRRTKIWEFNTNLHCSIIGTCLSAAELRQILKKLGLAAPDSTDHELHGTAVGLAGRHDKAAKPTQQGARREASSRDRPVRQGGHRGRRPRALARRRPAR